MGVIVSTKTAPPASGAAIDTGVLHLTGPAGAGPTDKPVKCESMDEFIGAFSDRTGVTVPTFDYIDAFFREGGRVVNFARSTTSDRSDGLALLDDKRQGPGQLATVDGTPGSTLFADLKTVADATNRVVLRDVNLADTVTEMETVGGDATANDDSGATFGSWVNIPSPAGVIGAGPRQVPASAVIAALCNRVDRTGNPNRAAGGRDFPLQYVTSFVLDPSDSQRAALLGAGVNMFKNVYNVLENYNFQTNIGGGDPVPENPYWQFNVARLRMYAIARAEQIGESYYLKPIDGQGHLAGSLQKDIAGMFKKELYDNDALYGATPSDAFSVKVTETASQVAQGALVATAEFVPTLGATTVEIDLVTVPVGSPVS